jgi:hypothetical protein
MVIPRCAARRITTSTADRGPDTTVCEAPLQAAITTEVLAISAPTSAALAAIPTIAPGASLAADIA